MSTISLPDKFLGVCYQPARIPGVEQQSNLELGANCQLYAYELLRYFGFDLPPFRSSELWADNKYTVEVKTPRELDLMLYHRKQQSYGAHVGIYFGDGKVLHLSREIGYPAIQPHEELLADPKYAYLIGIKRPLLKARFS